MRTCTCTNSTLQVPVFKTLQVETLLTDGVPMKQKTVETVKPINIFCFLAILARYSKHQQSLLITLLIG